jgi:GNAT superfamily N-acetyltransferase
MIIKELTPAGLKEFINSEEFQQSNIIPITKHRALSHINNPRVDRDDVILFIAYQDNELAGYLGVLADTIYLNSEEHKVGWLSCIWTSEKVRGKGVAKQLLSAALNSWNNKILATEFTPAAKSLYDQTAAFMDFTTLLGRRAYLRFNLHELLPPKGFPKMLSGLLKIGDATLNIFNSLRLLGWGPSINIDHLNLEYIKVIDNETKGFIEKRYKNELIRRGAEELSWINKYPWVLSSPEEDSDALRYHFSSSVKVFNNLNIKLMSNEGEVIAFMMIVVRGNNLKIPYCYFDEEHIGKIVQVIYHHMFELNLNMVTTYNSAISNYFLSHRTPFIYNKQMSRSYLISKELGKNLTDKQQIHMQDGSGDCAFT